MEAERAAWQEQQEKNQARVEAPNIVEEFHRTQPRTEIQMRFCGNGCSLPSGEQA